MEDVSHFLVGFISNCNKIVVGDTDNSYDDIVNDSHMISLQNVQQ